ncbi:MAG TPA: tRNA pseudouridine(13) synthase TruD [Methanocorpusculum sp.]|nr:tRNA pseudouridine(13) synthase TruD [Methanocorpusculum sp.]
MKPSAYETETALGIGYYGTSHDGIGGRLRTSPEDFRVDELPVAFTGSGPYLICRLTKRSWEHQHAVRELANRLKISQKRIGWAGTKDRNAVTSQYISLYEVAEDDVRNISIKDMTIEPVTHHQFSLGLGNLEGNRFVLTLRDCDAEGTALQEQVDVISAEIRTGIPNYFGLQRFGAMKPVTHRMGYHILRGEYEKAVMLYVGDAFPYESDEVKHARRAFAETGDAKEALHALPNHLTYERILLDSLMKQKENYGAALQTLPPKLLSMFVSAYQSWLFNLAVSDRCRRGVALNEPDIGEHLVFANGRIDIATAKNLPTARQHMKRGRCFVVGWMPGKTYTPNAGPLEQTMVSRMEEDGISFDSFGSAAEFVRTNFDGFHRRISLEADVASSVSGADATLSFTLPPGHYATTVAREYMQANPEQMV